MTEEKDELTEIIIQISTPVLSLITLILLLGWVAFIVARAC